MNKDYKARSNKRRSKDSVVFEQNLERNLYGLWGIKRGGYSYPIDT